jgi:hypothetical protein
MEMILGAMATVSEPVVEHGLNTQTKCDSFLSDGKVVIAR